jgi:itaconate CoA-transferase
MPPPLDGILVVSIEQAVAAPFATRQLADLGARVIKIERPGEGDFARGYDRAYAGLSSYFVWLNRSKESLTLDLKRPAAKQVLARLIDRADVFVQNLAPGASDRLGTGSSQLREHHPKLITCDISGYGSSGPFADKKAYDMLVQAEVGLLSITGTDKMPSRVGISVADIAAGMYAYSGVLTALLTRQSTGVGTALEVSLFDALAEWMGAPAYYTAGTGRSPGRTGASHATIAPYELFVSKDGFEICIGIQNQREWIRLCEQVLGQPELVADARYATNTDRVEHRAELHDTIAAVVCNRRASEIIELMVNAGVAHARSNSIQEFLDHPQLRERDRWCSVDSPVGPLRALRPPVQTDDAEPVMGAIPALGQHSQSILEELGYDAGTIASWRTEGVI